LKPEIIYYQWFCRISMKKQKNHNLRPVLRGMPAYRGKAKGMARIVSGDGDIMDDKTLVKNLAKIKPGDILVTEMTRPLFVIAMRKAAAIITDRGGILCHAAMVAREFKVPCIVNTKKATKILKNGQLILIDADKGIVYEI